MSCQCKCVPERERRGGVGGGAKKKSTLSPLMMLFDDSSMPTLLLALAPDRSPDTIELSISAESVLKRVVTT